MQAQIGKLALAAVIALPPWATAHAQSGVASHYSDLSMTASGRAYSSGAMVAAHRTLPFGTKVRVRIPAQRPLRRRDHRRSGPVH